MINMSHLSISIPCGRGDKLISGLFEPNLPSNGVGKFITRAPCEARADHISER